MTRNQLLIQRNHELRQQVDRQQLTIGSLQDRADKLLAGYNRATDGVIRLLEVVAESHKAGMLEAAKFAQQAARKVQATAIIACFQIVADEMRRLAKEGEK